MDIANKMKMNDPLDKLHLNYTIHINLIPPQFKNQQTTKNHNTLTYKNQLEN